MSIDSDRMTEAETLPIAEVAARTGLSAHTLRYYEKAGLISPVSRAAGGQRRYSASDLDWIAFLLRLRDTRMSISDMQRFATLRAAGPSTVQARLDLLANHRSTLDGLIKGLLQNATELDLKIQYYTDLVEAAAEQDS